MHTPIIWKGLLGLVHAPAGMVMQTPASGPTPCSPIPGPAWDRLLLGPGPCGALPSLGVCCPGPSMFEATHPPMRKPRLGASADALIHLNSQPRARGLAYLPWPPPTLGGGPQPREVFKGLVNGSGGPGDGEACPGWAAGLRPEMQREGQARRPPGRSMPPSLSLPPSPPTLGHPLFLAGKTLIF